MLTRKPCKYCGSLWHSKAKCPEKPQNPFKPTERTQTPLSTKKPSQSLRTRQKGKNERAQLVSWADKYFSIHIRSRGSDGVHNTCYTCDAFMPWEDLQCGHFMPRRFFLTRWHELNCWPQCNDCNSVKGGNLVIYEQRLRKQFGDEAIDELKQYARSGNKVTTAEIGEVVEKYKE